MIRDARVLLFEKSVDHLQRMGVFFGPRHVGLFGFNHTGHETPMELLKARKEEGRVIGLAEVVKEATKLKAEGNA